MWSLDCTGYAYGGHISSWLSDVLESSNLDLVGFGEGLAPRSLKQMNKGTPGDHDETIYADYSPFMLISEPSLDDLNKRLEKKVSMRNFRPNFVVKNCSPYAEVIN